MNQIPVAVSGSSMINAKPFVPSGAFVQFSGGEHCIEYSSVVPHGDTDASTCDAMFTTAELDECAGGDEGLRVDLEDPDTATGSGFHWIIYNLRAPPIISRRGFAATENGPGGSKQGMNGFKNIGYGGPCPPPRSPPHRYIFRLFALNAVIEPKPKPERPELNRAMAGHVLAQAELMGIYRRRQGP